VSWISALFIFASIPTASAAPTILFSSLGGSGCVTAYGGSPNINAMRFRATTTFTANIARQAIGTQSTTNFAASRFYIMSSNPSGGTPLNTLAIFTPDTITGTGVNTIASYVGNVTINSGTTFWLVFGQKASVFSHCYIASASMSSLAMNGAVVDTSTSLSNTSWTRGQSTIDTQPAGGTFNTYNTALAYQISLEYQETSPTNITTATQDGSTTAIYRTNKNIIAAVNPQSRVTFFVNGKTITGCRNILSSGGNATCAWKPSVKGVANISARAVPLDNFYSPANSSTLSITVLARTGRR
jgi:hypothetical protein